MTIGEIFNSRIIDKLKIIIYPIDQSSAGLSIWGKFEDFNKLPRKLAIIEVKEIRIKEKIDNTIAIMISSEDMKSIFDNKDEIDDLLELARIKR